MGSGEGEAKSEALRLAEAILGRAISPQEGAHRIWMDVTTQVSNDQVWDWLAPFIAYATDWQDHPKDRAEIEESIRNHAQKIVALWGPQR